MFKKTKKNKKHTFLYEYRKKKKKKLTNDATQRSPRLIQYNGSAASHLPTIFEVLAAYNKYGWPTPLKYIIVLSTAAPGTFQSIWRMQHNAHICIHWQYLSK